MQPLPPKTRKARSALIYGALAVALYLTCSVCATDQDGATAPSPEGMSDHQLRPASKSLEQGT